MPRSEAGLARGREGEGDECMSEKRSGTLVRAAVLASVLVLAGCAASPDGERAPHDPWEPFNRVMFDINSGLDDAVLRPIALTYRDFTPDWLREAVFNFFTNAAYPGTAINQFLQGKFERGFEDIGKFILNSTFGLAGAVDFAGDLGFTTHEEDFDQTLAVWGVPQGPYLELPFFGPNTVRSALMIWPNSLTDVTYYLPTDVGWALTGLEIVNDRSRIEGAIRLRDETALDPYVFQREGYLQRRRSLIYDGNPPLDDLDLELEELPEGEGTTSTTQ